jgi:hypothetical protein
MTDEYVKLLTSVNGDRPTRAVRTLGAKDTFRLSLGRRDGISTVLYEITHYPPGFACPYGWQEGGGGVYYCIRDDGLPAPEINLGIAPWGKYVFRATGNGGYRDGVLHNWPYDGTSMVDQTAVQVLSPTFGFESFADNEGSLCDDGGQAAILDRNFRKLEGYSFGGGSTTILNAPPLLSTIGWYNTWNTCSSSVSNNTCFNLMYLKDPATIRRVSYATYAYNYANYPFNGGAVQLGIYNMQINESWSPNGKGWPYQRVGQTALYTPQQWEVIVTLDFTSPVELDPGFYWIALCSSAQYYYILVQSSSGGSTQLGYLQLDQRLSCEDDFLPATFDYSSYTSGDSQRMWLDIQ